MIYDYGEIKWYVSNAIWSPNYYNKFTLLTVAKKLFCLEIVSSQPDPIRSWSSPHYSLSFRANGLNCWVSSYRSNATSSQKRSQICIINRMVGISGKSNSFAARNLHTMLQTTENLSCIRGNPEQLGHALKNNFITLCVISFTNIPRSGMRSSRFILTGVRDACTLLPAQVIRSDGCNRFARNCLRDRKDVTKGSRVPAVVYALRKSGESDSLCGILRNGQEIR